MFVFHRDTDNFVQISARPNVLTRYIYINKIKEILNLLYDSQIDFQKLNNLLGRHDFDVQPEYVLCKRKLLNIFDENETRFINFVDMMEIYKHYTQHGTIPTTITIGSRQTPELLTSSADVSTTDDYFKHEMRKLAEFKKMIDTFIKINPLTQVRADIILFGIYLQKRIKIPKLVLGMSGAVNDDNILPINVSNLLDNLFSRKFIRDIFFEDNECQTPESIIMKSHHINLKITETNGVSIINDDPDMSFSNCVEIMLLQLLKTLAYDCDSNKYNTELLPLTTHSIFVNIINQLILDDIHTDSPKLVTDFVNNTINISGVEYKQNKNDIKYEITSNLENVIHVIEYMFGTIIDKLIEKNNCIRNVKIVNYPEGKYNQIILEFYSFSVCFTVTNGHSYSKMTSNEFVVLDSTNNFKDFIFMFSKENGDLDDIIIDNLLKLSSKNQEFVVLHKKCNYNIFIKILESYEKFYLLEKRYQIESLILNMCEKIKILNKNKFDDKLVYFALYENYILNPNSGMGIIEILSESNISINDVGEILEWAISQKFYEDERESKEKYERITNIIKKMITKGGNIYATNGDGITPIIYACDTNNISLADFIISNGYNINYSSEYHQLPLIFVSKRKNTNFAKFLIDRGANVNCINSHGTLIEEPIDRHLISSPSRIIKIEIDYTPLIYACLNNDIELVEYLLLRGADINHVIDSSKLFKRNTYEYYSTQVSELIDSQNSGTYTALTIAVLNDNTHLVIFLLEKGADPNISRTISPLVYYYNKEDYNMVKLLLEKQTDINHLIKYDNREKDIPFIVHISNKTDSMRTEIDILILTTLKLIEPVNISTTNPKKKKKKKLDMIKFDLLMEKLMEE